MSPATRRSARKSIRAANDGGKKSAKRPVIIKSGYAAPPRPRAKEFADARVVVLLTRWNKEIVDALMEGAQRCFSAWGVAPDNVSVRYVPGAFELPMASAALMKNKKRRPDGVLTLGAVIRGDTPHFDFVAGECSRGLREASQTFRVPLGFGVLTVDNIDQALERCGAGRDNKGYEAAAAMLEMVRFMREVRD